MRRRRGSLGVAGLDRDGERPVENCMAFFEFLGLYFIHV
jgi:hypothetical protein